VGERETQEVFMTASWKERCRGEERPSCQDRRKGDVRYYSGPERRSGTERRSGRDRRNLQPDTEAPCSQLQGIFESRLTMKKSRKKSGIHLFLKKYRSMFRIPENKNHYSEEDYKNAERMFLKHALEQRRIEMQDDLFK
jgi:hypothetical protein